MKYDVVVVGGGIGGLVTASLLATRGVSTCVLERQSQVGGCIARTEFSGLDFDPGVGVYTSFAPGDLFDQIFSELRSACPDVIEIETPYLVRLKGDTDVSLHLDDNRFAGELERVFPECGQAAIDFYQRVKRDALARVGTRRDDSFGKQLRKLFSRNKEVNLGTLASTSLKETVVQTSVRFQRFLDAQLRTFLHSNLDATDYLSACEVLTRLRSRHYMISGGPATLAERLAEAFRSAGGVLRLNSPVLRLAFDEDNRATGVDLLSGETVNAKRAIVSNMTIWDTYGKLVGLNRTPPEIKKQLSSLQSLGAYVLYAAMDESAAMKFAAQRMMVASSEVELEEDLVSTDMAITIRPESVDGKRAVTVKTSTEVAPWFAFQTSEEDYEARDQSALELLWSNLHEAIPEFGSSIEAIETSSPRTCYDLTRRKLGMVMGAPGSAGDTWTAIPNLFMIGDTVSPTADLASVAQTAATLASNLSK